MFQVHWFVRSSFTPRHWWVLYYPCGPTWLELMTSGNPRPGMLPSQMGRLSLLDKTKRQTKILAISYVAPCKVIWIPQSGGSLLVESKITGNICLWNPQSGILGFKIRNPAQEIQNPANDWNPEYKFCWSGIWNSVPGIRNQQCRIQNSRLYWITWHGASYDIAHGLKHIISNCNQFLFCF